VRYNAFLSYSHAADGRLAPALQSALHRLAKPWYRLRQLRVFRDQTNLAASPGLWSSIEAALADSEWFLYMASPAAAQSPWVQREIGWWLERRSPATLLIVLSDGDLRWDGAVNDFDWQTTTALPALARGAFGEEPLFVDLRWARNTTDLSIRHTGFRGAVLDLAAAISRRSKDELDGEDVRQNRIVRRLTWSAGSLLVVLTVLALSAAVFAMRQRNEAIQQRNRALSRQLAVQSATELPSRLDRALLLGTLATQIEPTLEARQSLMRALLWPSGNVKRLWAHAGTVTSIAFSADGRHLVSASEDAVVVWDTASNTAGTRVPAGAVTAVAWSPRGDLIATADRDGRVRLWNAETLREAGAPISAHTGRVFSVVFSGDGRTLASAGSDRRLMLWDVSSRRAIGTSIPGRLEDFELRFSIDGRTVVAPNPNGGLSFWSVRTGQRDSSDAIDATTPVAFHPSAPIFAAQGRAGTVGLWDARSRRRIGDLLRGHGDFIASLAFSPDGTILASSSGDGTIMLWDVARRERTLGPLRSGAAPAWTVAFSPDGRHLAAAGPAGTLAVWDLEQPHALGTRLHVDPRWLVVDVAFGGGSDALTALLLGRSASEQQRWSTTDRRPTSRVAISELGMDSGAAAVTLKGSTLVAVVGDSVSTWNAATGQRTGNLPPVAADQAITAVAITEDERAGVYATDAGTLHLWDAATRRLRGPALTRHHNRVDAVAFDRTGKWLVSGSTDGEIALWDANAGTYARTFGGGSLNSVFGVAFSPDGHLVAAGQLDGLSLWDVTSATLRREIRMGAVFSVAFTDDGRLLAAGGGDGRIVLFDVASGNNLGAALVGHTKPVERLAFSRDGSFLASTDRSGTMMLWDLDLARWRSVACATVNRSLTPEEWNTYVASALPEPSPVCAVR
jgi:YD repeat-containing protein